MAYRKPGIEVVQDFQNLTPALVLPTLPSVIIGPAFQIEKDATTADTYDGASKDYSYPNLAVGAVVDTRPLDSDEPEETQLPTSVKLTNAYVTKASGADGSKTDGSQTFTTTSNAFANIAPSATAKYYLELSDFGPDDGKHLIVSKNSDTSVELADEIQVANPASNYKVLKLETSLSYDNASFSTVGIAATASKVTLPANLPSDSTDATSDPVSDATDVKLTYRALRVDLADSLDVYTDLNSLEAVVGVGNVVPANPYAFGINTALDNTSTKIYGTGLRSSYYSDELTAYQTAHEFLESEEVYALVDLTQLATTHQHISSHVKNQSASSVGRERIGFINRKLQTKETIVPPSGTGTELTAGGDNGTSSVNDNKTFQNPTNGSYITDGVHVGDYVEIESYVAIPGADPVRSPLAVPTVGADSLTATTKTIVKTLTGTWTGFVSEDVGRAVRIAASSAGNTGEYTIVSVTDATTVVVAEAIPSNETGGAGNFTFQLFQLAPTSDQTSHILNTRHAISNVDSNTKLTLSADPTNGFWGALETIAYAITGDLSTEEQADFLSGYAASFTNRRLFSVVPDTCVMSVGGTDTLLPGFYVGCALAGLVSGLPSQQGFTNLSLTGFTGLANGGDIFSDDQLNTIAGGGNLIVLQDVAQAPIYVRHQLSTNTSSIQFQELSMTKNVDQVAKFFRRLYRPYIGIYNITDALIDILKTTTEGGISFLKNSKAPRVGGVIRDGELSSIEEDSTQPDQVLIVIDPKISVPLNNIKVTLLV